MAECGYGALDDHVFGIQAGWELFSAGARHEFHTCSYAAHSLSDCTHGYAAPDYATCSTHLPRGSAGFTGEETTAITGALQHHDGSLHLHGFEFAQCECAWVFDAVHHYFPGIAICNDGAVWRGQVVADVQLIGGRDHAGTKGATFGLDGGVAVNDEIGLVFPVHVCR